MAAHVEGGEISRLEMLPVEIFNIICRSLEFAEACALALVSKRLRIVVRQLAFTRISAPNRFLLRDGALREYVQTSALVAINLEGCLLVTAAMLIKIAEHGKNLTSLR